MAKKIYKGDRVTVSVTKEQMADLAFLDPESHYYISTHVGMVGQVFDITKDSSGFDSYHVNFGKEIGIFYTDEVTLVQ